MIYIEYESYRLKYLELQEQFNRILTEKERLFTKTLPNAIRYDKEHVQCSPDTNTLEEYVINLDEKKIDESLARLRQLLEDRGKLLELKEQELRKSQDKDDRVYCLKYLDGYGINKICKIMSYSRSQIYKILNRISKRCKMRQNETFSVL